MLIRAYQNSDQEAVVALWTDCDLVVPWNDPVRDIERKLQVDRDLFLVGCRDEELIATVMAGYEGHRGWINYLAIRPSERRKGYGEDMMRAAEVRLSARRCPKINLQVRDGNTNVIAFYEAIGYTVDAVVGLGKRLESD